MPRRIGPGGPFLAGPRSNDPIIVRPRRPGDPWLNIVLASWAASVAFSPLFIGSFTPEQNQWDNPPFGAKPWLEQVVYSWQPGPPEPYQRRTMLVQGGVSADQPYGSGVTVIEGDWDQDQPARQARRLIPQDGSVLVSQPTPSDSLGVVRLWWQLPDEPPRQRDLGQIVSVDNPPFAQRRAPPALLWDAPVWDAQRRDPLLVLVNDDPPYASRRPPAALAWDDVTWSAQRRPIVPQTPAAAVNDPPFAQRRNPPALLWDAPVWDAQRRDPLLVLVNDDPPYASRRAPAALAWDAPAWNAQSAPRTPQTPASAVNDPPFASRRAPPALAWEQMWWNAQTRDPLVVLVNDNPPFGARPWVSRLVALWQPIPPERVIVRRYTADNPLIPGVFPPDSPVHFRISVPTRRLGEPNEAPEPERLGNSSESPQPSRLGEANESPDSERLGSANITPPARRLGEENT